MRGPGPLMVSCGGVAIPGHHRSTGKISGLDVVDGSVRIYVRSMAGKPGRGLSSGATMTRYWSPSSPGMGMVGGRAVWAARVVTFDGSGSRAVNRCGARCGMCTDVEGGKLESGASAQWNDTAGAAGVGVRMEGVVMGCRKPQPRGSGAKARVGADWCGANRACRRAFRDGRVCCWWAGGQRRLSRSCHKWCETWWDGGR